MAAQCNQRYSQEPMTVQWNQRYSQEPMTVQCNQWYSQESMTVQFTIASEPIRILSPSKLLIHMLIYIYN